MAVLYFFLSITAAILLFGLRRTRPFIYGSLECVVGTIGLVFAFYPQTALLPTAETTPLGLALSRGIAIVGAIYLLVRGMDKHRARAAAALAPALAVPEGFQVVRIPTMPPRTDVVVELVGTTPPAQSGTPANPIPDLMRVIHSEGEGRFVATATQIIYPRWFNFMAIALWLLGLGTFFFLIYRVAFAVLAFYGLI